MRNSNNLRRLQYDPREVRELFFDLMTRWSMHTGR
jgi:hypothetical protein